MLKNLTLQRLAQKITHPVVIVFSLVALMWLGNSTASQASIMLPEGSFLTAGDNTESGEQLLADYEEKQGLAANVSSSTAPASSLPIKQDEPTPEQEDLAQQLAAMIASQSEGSSTGTSSSGTGTGGVSSGATLLASHASAVPTLSPIGRYAEEQSLFLPEAPGNQFLRPPQA